MVSRDDEEDDYGWERWWFPRASPPLTHDDGVLIDPAGSFGPAISPTARRLEDLESVRCLCLLGTPGMGKSHELARYRELLEQRGERVATVDLGAVWSEEDLERRLDEPLAELGNAAAPLTLLLDGLDEGVASISRLAEMLAHRLDALDRDLLRVRIASRPVGWPSRFEDALRQLWPDVDVYVLASLTEADIARAESASLGGSDAELLAAARSRGSGMLASQPATLRLLIKIMDSDGELPGTRLDLYDRACQALLTEEDPRRRLDQTPVAVGASRPVAAEAATLSVLAGRPRLALWDDASSDALTLMTDLSAHDGDAIEAVWTSGLIRHDGENAGTWVHRSIAEFLAAEALEALPFRALRALLEAPSAGGRVAPHLMGVATWLSFANPDVFDWLVDLDPEALLTDDLGQRTESQRTRIGAAVLARIRDRIAPGWVSYNGLTYPGLAAELRGMLAPTEERWVRREAIRVVANISIRDVDDILVDIVEAGAVRPDYDDDVELATMAAMALQGCEEDVLVDRLGACIADESVHPELRAELVLTLRHRFNFMELVGLIEQGGAQSVHYRLVNSLVAVAGHGIEANELDEVVTWLTQDPEVAQGRRVRERVAEVVMRWLGHADPADAHPLWVQLGALVSAELRFSSTAVLDWRPEDLDEIGDEVRRRLVFEALRLEQGSLAADTWSLRSAGLLRAADFEYWLERYGDATADGPQADIAEAAAANVVDLEDDAHLASAQRLAAGNARLASFMDAEMDDAARQRHIEGRELAVRSSMQREAENAEHEFSTSRLTTALAAGDVAEVMAELRKPLPGETGPGYVEETSVSSRRAWSTLDVMTADAVLAAAVAEVGDGIADREPAFLGDVLALVVAERPTELEDASDDQLMLWWIALVDRPGWHRVCEWLTSRLAERDPNRLDEEITQRVRDGADAEYVGVLDRIGSYTSDALIDALAESLAADGPPRVAGALATAGLERDVDQFSAICQRIVRNRPPVPTTEDGDEPVVVDHDNPAARGRARATYVGAALATAPDLSSAFAGLLAEMRNDVVFAMSIIRLVGSAMGPRSAFLAASADQLVDLFLWARDALPTDPLTPSGTVMSVDSAKEFAGRTLTQLTQRRDAAAAVALARVAATTGDPWHRRLALETHGTEGDDSPPPAVAELREALHDPDARVVATPGQLMRLTVEVIDVLADKVAKDAALRGMFWHRQLDGAHIWMPVSETEFSARLAVLLQPMLAGRVVRREVELQPRLGDQAGQEVDIEVTAINGDDVISIVIEVKCNWHAKVTSALDDQLTERYLTGPHGRTGIYLVGYFDPSDQWSEADSRKGRLTAKSPAQLEDHLSRQAEQRRGEGFDIVARVVQLPLEVSS